MNKIYVGYGMDMTQMTQRLLREAEVDKLLRPGMRVCIKPNLEVARPAHEGATTHPEIVEGIILFLHQAGIEDITIAEGASVGDSTKEAFAVCGYEALRDQYGVELVDTKSDRLIEVSYKGATYRLCRSVVDTDFLINVPVLKAHCQTHVTSCLQNLKGCIPDVEKRRFHTMGLHEPLANLSVLIRPQLHVVDNICGDLSFEDGGNPVIQDRIIVGFDPVLLDSYGAKLIGYRPDEIRHLMLAARKGVGELHNSSRHSLVELDKEKKPKSKPAATRLPQTLARHLLERNACSSCYAAGIQALYRLGVHNGRWYMERPLSIGQGYRGEKGEGTGIGNCCAGFENYVPGCPPSSQQIMETLRELKDK